MTPDYHPLRTTVTLTTGETGTIVGVSYGRGPRYDVQLDGQAHPLIGLKESAFSMVVQPPPKERKLFDPHAVRKALMTRVIDDEWKRILFGARAAPAPGSWQDWRD